MAGLGLHSRLEQGGACGAGGEGGRPKATKVARLRWRITQVRRRWPTARNRVGGGGAGGFQQAVQHKPASTGVALVSDQRLHNKFKTGL
jgi:hypothetical protein